MESFEIDLEDLDLKSVDIKPPTPTYNSGEFRNFSFNNGGNNASRPNLTISTSNNDPMPSGLSSDKEVDFGLGMIVNKKKLRPDSEVNKIGSNSGSNSPTPKSAFSSMFQDHSSDTLPEKVNINNTEFLQQSLFDDNMTNIDLDNELNSMNLDDIQQPVSSMSGPSLPKFGSGGSNNFAASATSGFGMNNNTPPTYGSINTGSVSATANLSFEEIQKRKFELLCKFERLRDKGARLPKTFSMSSDYEEMNNEYERLIYHRRLENSVKMQRHGLISVTGIVEKVNNTAGNPFDLHLDGWSEYMTDQIMSENSPYDDIFEELYDDYHDKIKWGPEWRLMAMVAGSAFWFHMSHNLSKKFLGGGMDNIFKNNPNLMEQFQNAAMGQMGQSNPGMSSFMNMGGGPPKYNPMAAPPFSNPRDAPPRGGTNINNTQDIDDLIDSIGK